MQALRLLFSPSGRISPQPFLFAAAAVYIAGVASQWLTTPEVIARAGLWPFLAMQIPLTWAWYVVHAKRLHDAGRGAGLPVAIALLYALSVALLVIVAVAFVSTASAETLEFNRAGALGLILFVGVMIALLGSPQYYDVTWLTVVALTAIALLPVILAVVCTLWAVTRPSVKSAPV